MAITDLQDLYYTFGASAINYEVVQNFRALRNEKMKRNLKLVKEKILPVNNSLLFTFVFFSYRQRVISKHPTLSLV